MSLSLSERPSASLVRTDAGMYDLGYQLHNPFGDRRLDVAHETIGGGTRELAMQIARVSDRLPPALANSDAKPESVVATTGEPSAAEVTSSTKVC